jgi:hypothetical protein
MSGLQAIIIILGLVVMSFFLVSFTRSSETIEKIGECPPGWQTCGKYCVPGKYAKYVILKKGECPVGFQTSGKYCVKTGK